MIYIRLKEILQEKEKTKYWLIKNMSGNYQALSYLMNNETTGIRFDTLEKLCNILECDPGDIIVKKNENTKTNKTENKKSLSTN